MAHLNITHFLLGQIHIHWLLPATQIKRFCGQLFLLGYSQSGLQGVRATTDNTLGYPLIGYSICENVTLHNGYVDFSPIALSGHFLYSLGKSLDPLRGLLLQSFELLLRILSVSQIAKTVNKRCSQGRPISFWVPC